MKAQNPTRIVSAVSAMAIASLGSLHAALIDLETLQSGQASLEFQYKFEGGDDSTRLADGSGNSWTLQRVTGADGGDVNNIVFGTGYDGASQAYSPSYDLSSYRIGAGLNTVDTTVPISQAVTIEAVVRFDTFTAATGASGAYIFSVRAQPNNQRGYFLRQLAPTGGGDGRLTTTLGDTFGDQVNAYDPYAAGDWYYVALVANYDSGGNQTTVNIFGANLTQGETDLTLLATDNTLFQGDWSGDAQVGIGNFLNGSQEYFEGAIDNIALYNGTLSQLTLEAHLDALVIPVPEPSISLLGGFGLLGLLRRRRR